MIAHLITGGLGPFGVGVSYLLTGGLGGFVPSPPAPLPTYLVPSVAAAGGFIDPNRTLVTRT